MFIEICPITAERLPYFQDLEKPKACVNEPEFEWQFIHYALAPVKTYKDNRALIQARLNGENAYPHVYAPVVTECSVDMSCGEIKSALDFQQDSEIDLYNLDKEDKACRELRNELKEDWAKCLNDHQELPLIRMCEPLHTIKPPQEISACPEVVGKIHPLNVEGYN